MRSTHPSVAIPVETIMPEPSKFWDKNAERYYKEPIKDEEFYQHKLQITRELLRPDMELLEFGCGFWQIFSISGFRSS